MGEEEQDNELRDFVRETLRQIKEGAQGHRLDDAVHFKVAIAKSIGGKGELQIKVLGVGPLGGISGDAEGELITEHASEVGFSIRIDTGGRVGGITPSRRNIRTKY